MDMFSASFTYSCKFTFLPPGPVHPVVLRGY